MPPPAPDAGPRAGERRREGVRNRRARRVARTRVARRDRVGHRAARRRRRHAVGLGDRQVSARGQRVAVGRRVVARRRIGHAGGAVTVAVLESVPVAAPRPCSSPCR